MRQAGKVGSGSFTRARRIDVELEEGEAGLLRPAFFYSKAAKHLSSSAKSFPSG